MEKYNLPTNLEEIKSFGKNAFRNLVNKSVTKVAFDNLVSECASHKKTADLEYESLQVQEYLLKLFPHQARTIIKCRSETVDVKLHMTHKYKDTCCRRCGNAEENISHIINCQQEETIEKVNTSKLDHLDYEKLMQLQLLSARITSFLDAVEQWVATFIATNVDTARHSMSGLKDTQIERRGVMRRCISTHGRV